MDIAFGLLIPIFLGLLIGQYLDSKYSSEFPLWTVIFTFAGAALGLWDIYKRYIK